MKSVKQFISRGFVTAVARFGEQVLPVRAESAPCIVKYRPKKYRHTAHTTLSICLPCGSCAISLTAFRTKIEQYTIQNRPILQVYCGVICKYKNACGAICTAQALGKIGFFDMPDFDFSDFAVTLPNRPQDSQKQGILTAKLTAILEYFPKA